VSHRIIHTDCVHWLRNSSERFNTIFADPPDNLGLNYEGFKDKNPWYLQWLEDVIRLCVERSDCFWLSFNSRWIIDVGCIAQRVRDEYCVQVKPCVQSFTFCQHNKNDLGNSHRPLWRFMKKGHKIYPDRIKVKSWRQVNKDKRAAAGGKVPGDVFDFPRVTGNSKQRRKWHVTQLNEGLVERCLKLTTPEGGKVLDPFGGTGTTLRVCKRIGMDCTLLEASEFYYQKICDEHKEICSQAVGLGGVQVRHDDLSIGIPIDQQTVQSQS
jgi:DNA modification methylase